MTFAQPTEYDFTRIAQESGIGRIHFSQEVDSTNNEALKYARNNQNAEHELFLAELQSAGRGRGGNQWWSAPGALTFSLLSRPLKLQNQQIPQISLITGLAICQAIEDFLPGADVSLKWPNDVFLGDRKLCGILIELPPQSEKRFVIGVGINVNNSLQDAPMEVQARAVSLIDSLDREQRVQLDRSDLLIRCLSQWEQCFRLLGTGSQDLATLWNAYSYLNGKSVCIEVARRKIAGECLSIAEDGALLVQTESGVEACYGGVVVEYH